MNHPEWAKPTKAVILARGLGTRMRAADDDASLTPEQAAAAAAGLKTLVPLANGKTLLELTVSNLKAAGFTEIILVIGPEHDEIRSRCAELGLDVRFAVQEKPLGTADAVLAAEDLIATHELFAVFNSDNLYPVDALKKLAESDRPSMLAFERQALIEKSNIPEDRIAKFATVENDEDGNLLAVIEKPEHVKPDALISMNAWLFSAKIFEACRSITLSPRGEYEITAAVEYAVNSLGEKIAVLRTQAGVLDLSSRADIESIEIFLHHF
ncbi:MAG: NTP transferase domain-containing protein [Acidobacteria bacterium]|nr:NTP transferase domain-containing protein [Acidobacteriota bacterium]